MTASMIYLATIWVIPVIIAITFHEAAHGFVAHLLGDDTAWRLGRVSFNPLKHVDPVGTILLPGILLLMRSPFLFGYAKPVPINFRALRNPRRDMVLVAAAGPAMNIALADYCSIGVSLRRLSADDRCAMARGELEERVAHQRVAGAIQLVSASASRRRAHFGRHSSEGARRTCCPAGAIRPRDPDRPFHCSADPGRSARHRPQHRLPGARYFDARGDRRHHLHHRQRIAGRIRRLDRLAALVPCAAKRDKFPRSPKSVCASVAPRRRKQIRVSALRRWERPRIRPCARTRRCSSQAAFGGLGGGDVPDVRQRKNPRHVDRTAGSHSRVVPSRSLCRHHRRRLSFHLLRHFRHQRLIHPDLHADCSELHTSFGGKLYRSTGSPKSSRLCHRHLGPESAGRPCWSSGSVAGHDGHHRLRVSAHGSGRQLLLVRHCAHHHRNRHRRRSCHRQHLHQRDGAAPRPRALYGAHLPVFGAWRSSRHLARPVAHHAGDAIASGSAVCGCRARVRVRLADHVLDRRLAGARRRLASLPATRIGPLAHRSRSARCGRPRSST